MHKLISSFLIIICFSCTTEEITTRPYPRLRTLEVTNVTNESVTFHGEVISSSQDILDHGFLWLDSGSPTFDNSEKISLGSKAAPGPFEAVCEWGMEKGKKYFVRSYAVSDDNVVYSNPVEFVSQGSKPPALTDFYPSQATWGDTITLVGNNFSVVRANSIVKFNGQQAIITSASNANLKVTVPYAILDESATISVSSTENQGTPSTLPKNFQLKSPIIESVSPSSGTVNTTIVIGGKFLGSTRVQVFFNNKPASITNLTVNSITCIIPTDLPTGQAELKVVTGNGGLLTTTTIEIL
jgi:hypothetical protein